MDLLKVVDIEDAQNVLYECLEEFSREKISIDTPDSYGNIIYEDLHSREDVPSFRRSAVDGYAVVSTDLGAASESVPVFLKMVGKVNMGKASDFTVKSGECVYVPTGGAVPEGADAMVMIEYTDTIGTSKISISQSSANGAHIIKIGEDTLSGDLIVTKGTVITSQVIGILSAAGYEKVDVCKPLKMAIISTGDEIVDTSTVPKPGQIREVNTYALSAQAQKNGYEVISHFVLPDDRQLIYNTINELKGKVDIICTSGGSSKGEKDFTADIINESGNPGVIIHGIAIKPGKPTILGFDKQTKTIMTGLPGHPVSAFIIFELLFGALNRKYAETQPPLPYYAKISQNLPGSPGKTTCIPVKLTRIDENHKTGCDCGYKATPVFGKSGLISTLAQADGYIIIDRNKEGLIEGEQVKVHMI